jgi:hypothetical protein
MSPGLIGRPSLTHLSHAALRIVPAAWFWVARFFDKSIAKENRTYCPTIQVAIADCARGEGWYNPSMPGPMTPEEFDALYIARVKALRQQKGLTSGQMATLLGIPAERYRKYESRTPMPHALIEQFSLITGVSVEFLVTGRRVAGKGRYPDVPGPHMIEQWRADRAASGTGNKDG